MRTNIDSSTIWVGGYLKTLNFADIVSGSERTYIFHVLFTALPTVATLVQYPM